MSENDEQAPAPPTAEMLSAWTLPAVMVNRFIVTVGRSGVRVAFGEQVMPGKDTNMHVAVYMSVEDAGELAGLLSDLVRRVNQSAISEPDHEPD